MRTRNRRLAYVTSIISGSLVGAFIHRYAGTNPILIIGITLKAIVAIWIALLPGVPDVCFLESSAGNCVGEINDSLACGD